MPTEPTTAWGKIHADAPVFDLHIHPAMNRLAIKQNLNIRHIVSRSFNPFAVRASWPQMKSSSTRHWSLVARTLFGGFTVYAWIPAICFNDGSAPHMANFKFVR